MKILITLGEMFEKCNNWEEFCDSEGYSVWIVNEGGDKHEIQLNEEKAEKYGIINTLKNYENKVYKNK
jgi:hypothetical protein